MSCYEDDCGMMTAQDMGWEKGSGLGQSATGQLEAIRVTKKDDRVGELPH